MSSFKEEVEKTRQMLENVNRRLTGTDDVVYFRPPIQIRLKKTNPNKSFKSFTSNYKTKTFDKLEYDRKKYIEFVCKHPDCNYDIITVFKVKSNILPENVYIFSGDEHDIPEYIKEIFLEKQEANILRVLYANKYDIISVFNPKMFDTLKKEVDEYNQAEEEKQLLLEKEEEEKREQEKREREKQEKRELEKIEREKRKKSWKYELKKLLDDFGGVSPSSPSPSKTRSKGGKKKRKHYAYTRKAHRT